MVCIVNHTKGVTMRQKREQITLDFPKALRLLMKVQAAKRNMTMRSWLMCVVSEAINKELELEK